VGSLISNMDKYSDWDNPQYYNIKVFKDLEKKKEVASEALLAANGGK
jgi:hypothetical protein